ncbi:hypothetical protein M0813_28178 [Anaeramoeba flamelloides]|uniref:Uncharacterized protein n=1 Tax=Anaeramoeba flamelloides TaxID=1746091 RepID=A0ABQ8XWX5_9EUKA|nr:hypothetical protein M0813_28178 [Anaeramoeba flamelloides]
MNTNVITNLNISTNMSMSTNPKTNMNTSSDMSTNTNTNTNTDMHMNTNLKTKTLKSLQSRLKNERSYRKRLLKLIKLDPTSIIGLHTHHLSARYIGLFKTSTDTKDVPTNVRIRRSCIELLALLTKRKKKTIERGLTAFLQRTYLLENTREYSRDWMVFTSTLKERQKKNQKGPNPRKRRILQRNEQEKNYKKKFTKSLDKPSQIIKVERKNILNSPQKLTSQRNQEKNTNNGQTNSYYFPQTQKKTIKHNSPKIKLETFSCQTNCEETKSISQETTITKKKETQKPTLTKQEKPALYSLETTNSNFFENDLNINQDLQEEQNKYQKLFYQMIFPSEPTCINGYDLNTSFNQFPFHEYFDNSYQILYHSQTKQNSLNCLLEHFV